MDGTIEITNSDVSEFIIKHIHEYKVITWAHSWRGGMLKQEVIASHCPRYTSTFWYNQSQPYQDVSKQYDAYIEDGFQDDMFKNNPKVANAYNNDNLGVWLTCFVAFEIKDIQTTKFLDFWYLQNLQYTTQDQISFPYVCFKTGIVPYTLPDNNVRGINPSEFTDFYVKHGHGN